MIGKRIKVNDYKFVYGQETIYVNVFAAFKNKKNGNKYIIYSYDNKKIYFGTLFVREQEIIVMTSKEDISNIIKNFIDLLLNGNVDSDYEVISLDNINSIQIIDESIYNNTVDINKLSDLTIPKSKLKEDVNTNKKVNKKKILLFLVIIVVIVIAGLLYFMKDKILDKSNSNYLCSRSSFSASLPCTVKEEVELTFDYKKNINNIEVKSNYIFTDTAYYKEFKDKSYFYKYINDGDTYKFDDEKYTYIVFSNINTEEDYFMPRTLEEFISYYKNNNYDCRKIEE